MAANADVHAAARHGRQTKRIADPGFVDVGIPAHGRPAYLQEAIESVLSQTINTWRLTICEDGSGEGEIARIGEQYLSDPRVQFRHTGEPIGAAPTMNKLLRAGRSTYLALLHDDDAWEPEFLERRIELLELHPECGAVFTPNLEIDCQSRVTRAVPPRMAEGVYEPEEMVPSLLLRNPIIPAAALIRRSALNAVGPQFDTRFRRIYDYELWVRLALVFPIGYLHAYDVRYRVHAEQSRRVTGRGREQLHLLDHFDQLLADRPELRLSPRQRARQRSGVMLSIALDDIQEGERRTGLEQVGRALALHGRSMVDVRVAAALVGAAIGPQAFRALRATARRHDVRLHRFPH